MDINIYLSDFNKVCSRAFPVSFNGATVYELPSIRGQFNNLRFGILKIPEYDT